MGIKGQKVNPIGWRLNVNRNWKDSWFSEIKNYKSFYLNKIRFIKIISSLFLINKGVLLVDLKLFKQSLNNFIILCFYYKIRKDKKKYFKIKQFKNYKINFLSEYNYDVFYNKWQSNILFFKILKNIKYKNKFKKIKLKLNFFKNLNKKNKKNKFLLKKNNYFLNKTTTDFFKKRKKWLKRRNLRKTYWRLTRNINFIKKQQIYKNKLFKWKLKKWFFKRSLFITYNKYKSNTIKYFFNKKNKKILKYKENIYSIFFLIIKKNLIKLQGIKKKLLLNFLINKQHNKISNIFKIQYFLLNYKKYFINNNYKLIYNLLQNKQKLNLKNKINNIFNIKINKMNKYFNFLYKQNKKVFNIKNISKKKISNIFKNTRNNIVMFNIISLLNFTSIYRLCNKNILKSNLYKNIWKQQNRLINQNFFKKRLINLYDFVLLTFYSIKFLNLNLCCKILTQHVLYLWIFFKSKSKRLVPIFFRYVKLILRIRLLSKNIETLKIQFKGRFDRWKRARSLVILTGSLPLQSYNTFIDFGSYSGLTKNGSFGLRIWTLVNKNITEFSNYNNIKNFLYYSI